VVGDSDVTVLLGGDVMLGRGVDQILPHPSDPEMREPYLGDARGHVRLAEHANGPIPPPVDRRWPWGEVLALLDEAGPHIRLINLEATITADGEFADRKPVCYRMHPDNLPALTALRPHVCALANNHILDFGYEGLTDTLAALTRAGIQGVGAGADLPTARRPGGCDRRRPARLQTTPRRWRQPRLPHQETAAMPTTARSGPSVRTSSAKPRR
jgi:poly-gamma-glutamate capsule biosynthesis protein CapA/YwtB (metallophosphatase superfamily)